MKTRGFNTLLSLFHITLEKVDDCGVFKGEGILLSDPYSYCVKMSVSVAAVTCLVWEKMLCHF